VYTSTNKYLRSNCTYYDEQICLLWYSSPDERSFFRISLLSGKNDVYDWSSELNVTDIYNNVALLPLCHLSSLHFSILKILSKRIGMNIRNAIFMAEHRTSHDWCNHRCKNAVCLVIPTCITRPTAFIHRW